MTESERKPSSRNPVLVTLTDSFAVFRDYRPLSVGIHKAILEKLPELNRRSLGLAMKIHTGSTRYLKAVLQGEQRFDLDGNPSGVVTDEQREQASTALRERFKKEADRRKEEIEQRKAEEQARQKRENLLKLAEKFNTR